MTPMSYDAFLKSEALVKLMIENMPTENKARENFICRTFLLLMGLRGRYNFQNLARYGTYSEQTYRNNYQKEFDFKAFNLGLIRHSCSPHLLNAFDPSFIPKSGKHTPNLGRFWSGCAGKALKGLEIGGFAVVDIENNTALSLEAVATPSSHTLNEQGKTLVDHYAGIVLERRQELESVSAYLAVDGYFAKVKFVDAVCQGSNLHLVSKLRSDADLRYLYQGKYKGRGRPRLYEGKIDVKNIDSERLPICFKDQQVEIYSGLVYAKTLKRKVRIAYLHFLNEGKPTGKYQILFSTDTELAGEWIYRYYKARFQIEFLFRDAKQFTGLTHSQARSEQKLHFHFNAALTTVSLAKAAHYLPLCQKKRKPFSMREIKNLYLNKMILDRFFTNFGLDPNMEINKTLIEKCLGYGNSAA